MPYETSIIKQIALAYHSFNDAFKRLPPAFDNLNHSGMPFPTSAHVYLLPYVENEPLYQLLKTGWKVKQEFVISIYLATADPHRVNDAGGAQDFPANLRVLSDKGRNTRFDADMPALAGIEPGSARTLLKTACPIRFCWRQSMPFAGKVAVNSTPRRILCSLGFFGQEAARRTAHSFAEGVTFQAAPSAEDCRPSPLTAQSFMQRSLLVAMADGSVRLVSTNVSPEIWNRLLQPNDGMVHIRDWGD